MIALRTFENPFYTMSTTLDGTDYVFEFRYSQRESCWYFSIFLTDGTLLTAGVKVICQRSLLSRFSDVRLPAGSLVAFANTADQSPPDLLELGIDKRVTLVYASPSDIP